MEEESNDSLSLCPSFNSYSSDQLSQTATRVSQEFNHNIEDDDDDEDFEFSLVRPDPDDLAHEIFFNNGKIHPVFPTFNRDVLQNNPHDRQIKPLDDDDAESCIRIPLRNFFIREDEEGEDEPPPSSSSSEAEELESVPPGTYCVWRPKAVESPSVCKKSNSTGSTSKRCRIRDFLRRCNSDGKEESFVFLTPKNREESKEKSEKNREENKEKVEKTEELKEKRSSGEHVKVAGKGKIAPSPHEVFYVRNRAVKEGGKRKSYLPYRQDLVGFFANVNGLGRSFPAF